ncbi:hypothetical protein TPY_2741 [Sulfobacillus acidophilus TPY]|nr:hypothetical protein TPY_2741 [Sulfobacillus acidophilus TPY]
MHEILESVRDGDWDRFYTVVIQIVAEIARENPEAGRRLADLLTQTQIRRPGRSELDPLPPDVPRLSVGPRRVPPLAMRIYIAGPMSGYPDYNFPAFFDAAVRLRAAGYDPINPADTGIHEGWTWSDYLRVAVGRLVREAQGAALLPGWESSRGAELEAHVARTLDMPVKPLEAWIMDGESTSVQDTSHV